MATSESRSIASLNQQIEEFNAERIPHMGITPLDQRVSRVVYDTKLDLVTCFDQADKEFLVLKREADGRFKGILKVKYHQAAYTGPGRSHSWGHVFAEFYLEKVAF